MCLRNTCVHLMKYDISWTIISFINGTIIVMQMHFLIRRGVCFRRWRIGEWCKCSLPRSGLGIEYSYARTYLPSSAIKVDDLPIRNLVCISSTRQRTCRRRYHYYRLLLCAATTITLLVISIVTRECLFSSSRSSTRIHFTLSARWPRIE